jgi:integrase
LDLPEHPPGGGQGALLPFAEMRRVNVIALRDEITTGPASADSHIVALKTMFNWAIDADLATFNPAARIDRLRNSASGHYTWNDDDRAAFEKRHPVGTMARLAYALIRYTAVRRSDVIRLGPQFLRRGMFHFTEKKGGASRVVGKRAPKPKRREIGIAPELRRVIDATPGKGDMVFLLNDSGRSFTINTFNRQFRKWCDEAELPQCSAHGVRKGTATELADNGASVHEIAALCGWTGAGGLAMAATYTAKADQTRLASAAILKL